MDMSKFYHYKAIKYKMLAEMLKKELENSKKSIDKSENVCYNKDTK